MFFQDATPDTSGYMIAGYVITFVILGIYVASMYVRNRNSRQDMEILDEMQKSANMEKDKPARVVTKKRSKK